MKRVERIMKLEDEGSEMQLGDFVDGDYAMLHVTDAANDEYGFERTRHEKRNLV